MHFFRSVLLFAFVLTVQFAQAQFDVLPPYDIEIEPVTNASVPGLHSFAFASSGGKWLFVGGRNNGLHGFSSNDGFLTQYANNDLLVVDTASWQYWTASLTNIPDSVADPLRSTNMQYWQEGNYLYMTGGYGYDSVISKYVTFPVLSALRVDSIIDAVTTGGSYQQFIRQLRDTNLAICGGEMMKMGNDYYLMFGHLFMGRYSDPPTPLFYQEYSNSIKKFNIIDNGTSLSIANYSKSIDTVNYHRRDLNIGPVVSSGGVQSWSAYGGVFKYHTLLPYREPIQISTAGINVSSYQQVMSQYTCAMMPVFDSVSNSMHTTFFGGISLYDYDPSSNMVNMDTLVPFISDVTTLNLYANGQYGERIMPVQLPARLGSNAKFITDANLPHYSNKVINIRSVNGRILAGYIYGGIRASLPNIGPTVVNDTIYRVYITPDYTNSIAEEQGGVELLQVIPNPAQDAAKVLVKLTESTNIKIELYDITGKRALEIAEQNADAGIHRFSFTTSQLEAGIYFVRVQTDKGNHTVKIVVMK
jgi:hypothetical protein